MEHKNHIRWNISIRIITEHQLQEGDFDLNNIIILDEERHYRKRLISEIIHQETGLQTDMEALPNAYLPIIELMLELLSRLVSQCRSYTVISLSGVFIID